jgi:hypothetical protein
MKLEEVLPALREGKKIRRRVWPSLTALELKGGCIFFNEDFHEKTSLDFYFKFDDWEIVKEKVKRWLWVCVQSQSIVTLDGLNPIYYTEQEIKDLFASRDFDKDYIKLEWSEQEFEE